MKKWLLLSSALVFAGPALAADLPVRMPTKAPPPVAAVPYTWTGCYVGGHVGAGWDRTTFADPGNTIPGFFAPPFVSQTIAPWQFDRREQSAGVLGGVQAGCDYQFASHWVVGIAGDFAWSDIHGAANDPSSRARTALPFRSAPGPTGSPASPAGSAMPGITSCCTARAAAPGRTTITAFRTPPAWCLRPAAWRLAPIVPAGPPARGWNGRSPKTGRRWSSTIIWFRQQGRLVHRTEPRPELHLQRPADSTWSRSASITAGLGGPVVARY